GRDGCAAADRAYAEGSGVHDAVSPGRAAECGGDGRGDARGAGGTCTVAARAGGAGAECGRGAADARCSDAGWAAGVRDFVLRLPATSANLGSGFDAAGLAMSLYLNVRANVGPEFVIAAIGRDAHLCSN